METPLQNATRTSKAVVLKPGSEGCIPYERKKPAMQKLIFPILVQTFLELVSEHFASSLNSREAGQAGGSYLCPRGISTKFNQPAEPTYGECRRERIGSHKEARHHDAPGRGYCRQGHKTSHEAEEAKALGRGIRPKKRAGKRKQAVMRVLHAERFIH